MEPTSTEQKPRGASPLTFVGRVKRKAAAGKALLVYLGTGSIGAALIAFLIFKGAGC
jgi:hypothetical protein